MDIKKFKTLIIFFLTAAIIIQTGKLWLGDISGYNFFYYVLGKNSAPKVSNNIHKIAESRIVINYGNKTFSVIYNSDERKEIFDNAHDIVKQLMQNGRYSLTNDVDWEELLNTRGIILDYSFSVPVESFAMSYLEKGGNLTTKFSDFDKIIIIPSRYTSDSTKVIFVQSELSKAFYYELDKNEASEKINKNISALSNENLLSYVSTKLSKVELFKDNIFIPMWADSSLTYKKLAASNPFKSSRASMGFIHLFFDNPSDIIGTRDREGSPIFSDDSTVVKYHDYGVLEYFNYEQSSGKKPSTLESCYSLAMDFIKRDASLKNKFFISKAVLNDDGWDFYLDYSINDSSFLFSEGILEELQMKSGIEITVKNSNITKYRRILIDITSTDEELEFDVDFLTALNDSLKNASSSNSNLFEDMSLIYLYDIDEQLNLSWRIR